MKTANQRPERKMCERLLALPGILRLILFKTAKNIGTCPFFVFSGIG